MSNCSPTLTRRQLLRTLGAVGLTANPLTTTNAFEPRTVAAIFFDSYLTIALRRALNYAGNDGFVASMPQLLHARANAHYENIIWNTWFTANSEECVVTTPQGNRVVLAVHGGGIFANPARIEQSLRADLDRANAEGLTGQYAAKISAIEARDALRGSLPDGSEFPVYAFDEFKRGIANSPVRYGVILDFDIAKKSANTYEKFDVLMEDPLMIIRAGGVEPLTAYLDKAKKRNNTHLMGNWHPYTRIDPDQPQTRICRLTGNKGGKGSEGDDQGLSWGYDSDYGITAGGLIGLARYVAVAPWSVLTSLQYLDFEL